MNAKQRRTVRRFLLRHARHARPEILSAARALLSRWRGVWATGGAPPLGVTPDAWVRMCEGFVREARQQRYAATYGQGWQEIKDLFHAPEGSTVDLDLCEVSAIHAAWAALSREENNPHVDTAATLGGAGALRLAVPEETEKGRLRAMARRFPFTPHLFLYRERTPPTHPPASPAEREENPTPERST